MPKPPGVEDAAREAIQRQQSQWSRVMAQVAQQLTALKDRVRGLLGGLDADGLRRQLNALLQTTRALSAQWEREATRAITAETASAVEIGASLVDAPLAAANLSVFAPDVTLPLMEVLEGFTADRVSNLSADMLGRLSAEMRLGALGAKAPYEVIESVADLLRADGQTARGFGSIANRAEAIVRTELGRIHSMATQRRMEQALAQFPDLQKEWRHSGNILNPRDGHRAYSGTRVPVREPFVVAPTRGAPRERLMFPRDPAASARSTVRCRCTAIPWRASWSESS